MAKPVEVRRRTLAAGRFIELQAIDWLDSRDAPRTWETAERTSGRRGVLVIPRLVPSGDLVLLRQHRPPARGRVVEFPAGLADEGESPEACALRELKEETGYQGRVVRMLPASFNSPGLSGEAVHVGEVEIDESLPENRRPLPDPEDGEEIEVVRLPRARAGAFLREELATGTLFDSKVVAYLLGSALRPSVRHEPPGSAGGPDRPASEAKNP
ncbi:MAG: NUDIX hydrolase [Planctomycetota bacterium]